MDKFSKYLSLAVAGLFFCLGIYILVSDRFAYLKKEIKVVFAVFLFLYGAYRIARILTKGRKNRDDA